MTELFVLDTHIWYWLVTAEKPLDQSALKQIDRAARRNEIMISIISVWELGMLEAKKRIHFADPIEDWISESLSLPGLRLASLTPDIALMCHKLPGSLHGDPADRLIVATAIVLEATLITRDKELLTYGEEGHAKVLAA